MQILTGHISPETAYVVDDYPYGFRLRCKIRYWLEHNPKKGTRFWSQTSNPKRPGLVWNKPKASTYSRFGGAMCLNADGHCTWTGLSGYDDVSVLVKWRDTYAHTMPEDMQALLKMWITRKLAYEQAKSEGLVKSTVTTTQYGCVTDANFGQPIAPPTVETRVLESDYTPEELLAMGRTLRTNASEQIGKLISVPAAE